MTATYLERSTVAQGPGAVLSERVALFLERDLFRAALADIERDPGWESDAESLRQLGRVLERFAPRARDAPLARRAARALYRAALARAADPAQRAQLGVDLGWAWLEGGEPGRAAAELEPARDAAPAAAGPHLGLIAVACAARDAALVRRRCAELHARAPDWHRDRAAVRALATSPHFAWLRESPPLFRACFRAEPVHLQALHERHRLDALEEALEALAALEDPQCEPAPAARFAPEPAHAALAQGSAAAVPLAARGALAPDEVARAVERAAPAIARALAADGAPVGEPAALLARIGL